ncbi:hypothetical protein Nepgr_024881 [Nepenthes gracilis]|uniref:Uncharacterized protein n=1 Tax=Nepenthes gracilis TaxID=150966 RepID=A0AAD3XZ70_NEPGR|nr:hypothetical protein Nepgr_024881 [Nepenthes gracilis]
MLFTNGRTASVTQPEVLEKKHWLIRGASTPPFKGQLAFCKRLINPRRSFPNLSGNRSVLWWDHVIILLLSYKIGKWHGPVVHVHQLRHGAWLL